MKNVKIEKFAKMAKVRKRFITLIEIMIVMFLIALITGVIAYNYRGTLEEGKAFKTKAAIEKLENILNLKVSQTPELLDGIESDWPNIVKESPLVQNPSALLKDGWGGNYTVTVEDGIIKVSSQRYDQYKKEHKTMFGD